MAGKISAVAIFVVLGCGGTQEAELVHARTVVERAWPTSGAPGSKCSDIYVRGDNGRYRAVGCGQTIDFECSRDVAERAADIECAPASSPRARSIQLARARQGSDQRWRNGAALGGDTRTKVPGPQLPAPPPRQVPEPGRHR